MEGAKLFFKDTQHTEDLCLAHHPASLLEIFLRFKLENNENNTLRGMDMQLAGFERCEKTIAISLHGIDRAELGREKERAVTSLGYIF